MADLMVVHSHVVSSWIGRKNIAMVQWNWYTNIRVANNARNNNSHIHSKHTHTSHILSSAHVLRILRCDQFEWHLSLKMLTFSTTCSNCHIDMSEGCIILSHSSSSSTIKVVCSTSTVKYNESSFYNQIQCTKYHLHQLV